MATTDEKPALLRRTWTLWFSFLGPAIAWLVHLLVSYAFVSIGCDVAPEQGVAMSLHLLTAIFAMVAVACGLVSYRIWLRIKPLALDLRSEPDPWVTFMSIGGLINAGLFLVIIVATWSTLLVLSPCG